MWVESYLWNYETEQKNERNNDKVISSFYDTENNIIQSYELNKTKDWADELALNQYNEYKNLKEQKEKPILQETREQLDREAMINEAKIMLYEKLWINENLELNNWWENFAKWIVDTLVLDNYDLAIQVWETKWTVIIDWIKQLFSSWENIKKIAEALWDTVMWLFSWDWYQTWKSVAELWLITTWVWAWIAVWKKSMKLWIKQISKLRRSAERVVESSSVKKVIWETTKQVDEIIPKKKVDIKSEVLGKLPENVRNLDLELDNYSPQQLEWLKQRLWLDFKATIDDIDLTYRLKLKDTLDRYRELSDINLARFWREILEELKKSWDTNPLQTLENEILRLEIMKDKWELLIVSVIHKRLQDKWFQLNKFSSIDEKWLAKLKERKYLQIRESTETWIWSYWLDPKYASFMISKWQLDDIRIYWGDNPRFIWYTIDELEWRAWVTLYDSMLSWKIWEVWDTKQMLDYTTETLIKAKAIYNMDERLWFPIHEWLKKEAINTNNWQMSRFFNSMKPYVEVHIFWWNSKNVREALSETDFINKYFNK